MTNTTVKVSEFSAYDLDMPVSEFLEDLARMVDKIPKEWRDSAFFETDFGEEYGSPYFNLELKYKRPETTEELWQRDEAQRQREKRAQDAELAQLAKLQAKYGSAV